MDITLTAGGLVVEISGYYSNRAIDRVWEVTGSFKNDPLGDIEFSPVEFPKIGQDFRKRNVLITSHGSLHGDGEFMIFNKPFNDGNYTHRLIVYKFFLGNCNTNPDNDWSFHSCHILNKDNEWEELDNGLTHYLKNNSSSLLSEEAALHEVKQMKLAYWDKYSKY